jgi:hypothetical protein
MKLYAYKELNDAQKEEALEHFIKEELTFLIEGFRYDDAANGDNFQAKVDSALAEADAMQTPWLAGEIIMAKCGKELQALALGQATDAIYCGSGGAPVSLKSLQDRGCL